MSAPGPTNVVRINTMDIMEKTSRYQYTHYYHYRSRGGTNVLFSNTACLLRPVPQRSGGGRTNAKVRETCFTAGGVVQTVWSHTIG